MTSAHLAPRRAPKVAALALVAAFLAPVLLVAGPARAAETEVRNFEVLVGSDKVGTSKLTITKQDDGTTLVKNDADVKVSILWVKITYWTREWELWKDGALQQLKANTFDDGDKRQVDVTRNSDNLNSNVNGTSHTLKGNVWTTTFWSLPAPDKRGEHQLLLDADRGKEKAGTLKFKGKEQCTAGGRTFACNHYLVSSDEDVNLWFDESDRMVRRETSKMGKTVAVVLTGITK